MSATITKQQTRQRVPSFNEPKKPTDSLSKWLSAAHEAPLVSLAIATIVATYCRDFFPWFVQQYWMAVGNYIQSLWDRFLQVVGDNPDHLYNFGVASWIFIIHWAGNLPFMYLDLYNPKWAAKYKFQPDQNMPLDGKVMWNAVKVTLFNQVVVSAPMVLGSYQLRKLIGNIPDVHILPSFSRIVAELVVLNMIDGVIFYYAHRLCHHRLLYKRVHKMHHNWTAPTALAANYCSPIEQALVNVLPAVLGPVLVGCHHLTVCLWFGNAILKAIKDHSGYKFPFMPASWVTEIHEFHHSKNSECFGKLGYLDYLHGTDKHYRAYLARKEKELASKKE